MNYTLKQPITLKYATASYSFYFICRLTLDYVCFSGEIDILSHAAVFIHQGNGIKSKVNVHHLQRGTYTIHPR